MSLDIASVLELTGFEKSCVIHGSWVTICHAAHLTGDQTIIIKNIQYVIPQLLKRYPRMRTRLYIEGYQHLLHFFDYDEKQFNTNLFYSIVHMSDNQSWQKIAENECNRNPYSDDGKTIFPLIHFMVLINDKSSLSNDNLFHLLLFSNHCAFDGRSGYILLNDFLTLITSSDSCNRKEPVNTQIIPCITQMTPRPYGRMFRLWSWISQKLYQHELRQLNHPHIPIKTTRINEQLTSFRFQPVKNNFLFTSSSSTLYSRLHEKCRSQNVTLNAPLFGCLLLAFHHCFPSNKKNNRSLTSIVVDLAVDMRSRLPQSPLTSQTVGFCVGICELKIKKQLPLFSTPFWSLAKTCMKLTNDTLASNDIQFILHFYNHIMNNPRKFDQLSRFFPNGLVGELCLSNLGKYPFSCDYNNGQLRLRGLHVINNFSIYYTTATFFITCAGDGQLDFSLSHVIESEEKASEFLNYYVHLVEACADADTDITLDQLLTVANSA